MKGSITLRIGGAVFGCAMLGIPLSSHADAGPSDRACESRLNDPVIKPGECIRPDALWNYLFAMRRARFYLKKQIKGVRRPTSSDKIAINCSKISGPCRVLKFAWAGR